MQKNLDILDIPIADITAQYVEYVELMREINLELAADYLVMAAMLAEIKSRMLLPRSSEDEENEDVIERILWFMLRGSRENSLNVSSHLPPQKKKAQKKPLISFKLTRRRIVFAAVFIVFALHTLFIIPLIVL